jgi:hypothetical protein
MGTSGFDLLTAAAKPGMTLELAVVRDESEVVVQERLEI